MTPADLMKEEQLRDLGDGQKLYTQTVTEITWRRSERNGRPSRPLRPPQVGAAPRFRSRRASR